MFIFTVIKTGMVGRYAPWGKIFTNINNIFGMGFKPPAAFHVLPHKQKTERVCIDY